MVTQQRTQAHAATMPLEAAAVATLGSVPGTTVGKIAELAPLAPAGFSD